MAPPTCPLCGSFDYDEIAKLMVKTGEWGRVPYHWMQAHDLRASAAGMCGASQPGIHQSSTKRCRTCALLRDAAESFLQSSGLTRSDASSLEYSVALQNPSSAALHEILERDKKSRKARTHQRHPSRGKSKEKGKGKLKAQDDDRGYHSGGSDSGESWLSVEESAISAKGPPSTIPTLKLLLRCNFTPPKAKAQDLDEEIQLELFTIKKCKFGLFMFAKT